MGPPKPTEKSKKLKKEPTETELKKTLKTNTQNEPVLAMEREARLKEEREPNESQKILKKTTSNQDSEASPKKRQNTSKANPKTP